ncbi:FKBP-type peptidyl-prolyl cis-trans isomerase [Actinotalea fermentans]|uniref:peptidylprolyl isomerase n=1 Tax=Actinotalea fermentans TaxID=43671 RepID=A0A511YZ23_9CELL|nr:FKBP-type peptidyl-prolyl cis-trans isomerase [Actinotalea fermentans]KGM16862.1 hypothetical protein N867_14710 [Actinotalea fermentans ATCC 43279 = JCM 9966 = DSM 3133]GEN80449.1 peptidylprolyl isomerase [Actinotalea fermentans]
MRRPMLAAVLAATLLLAACGNEADSGDAAESPTPTATTTSEPTGEQPPSAADLAALAAVAVEGPLGSAPTVTFDAPFEVSAPVARVDTPGAGEPITDGQLLRVHYMLVDGSTGEPAGSTWDVGAPQAFLLGDPNMPAAMNDVLAEQNVGVRFLLAVPGTPGTDGAEGTPSTVFVFEVVGAVPGRAAGTAVAPPAGLPTVTLAEDGSPSIEVGDATEPTELVAQTLIEGTGPAVQTGQVLTLQYTGWLWDGTTFDSSWENGAPFQTTIGAGRVIAGWDQGLVGKTVGSQVLLVIPSDLGYGPDGNGSIPGDATLIFVVDILDAS